MILANLKMTCFKTTTCPWFRPKFLIYEKDLIKLSLRNGEASDGETRDDVRAEKGKVVERGPLENVEKEMGCFWLENLKQVLFSFTLTKKDTPLWYIFKSNDSFT